MACDAVPHVRAASITRPCGAIGPAGDSSTSIGASVALTKMELATPPDVTTTPALPITGGVMFMTDAGTGDAIVGNGELRVATGTCRSELPTWARASAA